MHVVSNVLTIVAGAPFVLHDGRTNFKLSELFLCCWHFVNHVLSDVLTIVAGASFVLHGRTDYFRRQS
jgi:hypothetical protein